VHGSWKRSCAHRGPTSERAAPQHAKRPLSTTHGPRHAASRGSVAVHIAMAPANAERHGTASPTEALDEPDDGFDPPKARPATPLRTSAFPAVAACTERAEGAIRDCLLPRGIDAGSVCAAVRALLRRTPKPEELTRKQVRERLEAEFGCSLHDWKECIKKACITSLPDLEMGA